MEADWSVEIGAGSPTIALPWTGFRDLSALTAEQVAASIPEAAGEPALATALARMNAWSSRVRTSKCDVWQLGAEELDIYEFDTTKEEAQAGRASYLDVLPRDPAVFGSFVLVETWARSFARALALVPLGSARAEVVVRAACVEDRRGYALTLYAFGCGRDRAAATTAWASALTQAAAATMRTLPEAGETGE